jgi:hypothetical protein
MFNISFHDKSVNKSTYKVNCKIQNHLDVKNVYGNGHLSVKGGYGFSYKKKFSNQIL